MSKVLSFKCQSPFFELCRDGKKPFDIRLWDGKDKRFRALSQYHDFPGWWIEFVHPGGETFKRELLTWEYLEDIHWYLMQPRWIIMYLGEKQE